MEKIPKTTQPRKLIIYPKGIKRRENLETQLGSANHKSVIPFTSTITPGPLLSIRFLTNPIKENKIVKKTIYQVHDKLKRKSKVSTESIFEII